MKMKKFGWALGIFVYYTIMFSFLEEIRDFMLFIIIFITPHIQMILIGTLVGHIFGCRFIDVYKNFKKNKLESKLERRLISHGN